MKNELVVQYFIMKERILPSIILGCIIMMSCQSMNYAINERDVHVNMIKNEESLTYSSYLKEYKVIALSDRTPEALIEYPDRLLFSDNRIFVMDRRGNKVLMFDGTGKFLRSTANMVGKGHNEYIRVMDAALDEKDRKLYVHCDAPYQMMVFDLDLNLEKVIPMDDYMREIALDDDYIYGICYNDQGKEGYRLVVTDKHHPETKATTVISYENVISGRWTSGKSLMPCTSGGVYVCLPFDTHIYQVKEGEIVESFNMDFGAEGLIENPISKGATPQWFDRNCRDLNWTIVNMTGNDSILIFNTNREYTFIMDIYRSECKGYSNWYNDLLPFSFSRILPTSGIKNGIVYFLLSESVTEALKQAEKKSTPLSPVLTDIKEKFNPNGNPLIIVWTIR